MCDVCFNCKCQKITREVNISREEAQVRLLINLCVELRCITRHSDYCEDISAQFYGVKLEVWRVISKTRKKINCVWKGIIKRQKMLTLVRTNPRTVEVDERLMLPESVNINWSMWWILMMFYKLIDKGKSRKINQVIMMRAIKRAKGK